MNKQIMNVDIDKLEALRAAATQGPFENVPPPPNYSIGFIGYFVERDGQRLRGEFPASDADDEYTVALLNAAPALLAELRRLRADLRTAVDLLDAVEQDQVQGELWCDARHAFLAALAAKEKS
jgi:hypothetical protein